MWLWASHSVCRLVSGRPNKCAQEEADDPVEVLVGTRGKWMFVKDYLNKKIVCHSKIQEELGKGELAGEMGGVKQRSLVYSGNWVNSLQTG